MLKLPPLDQCPTFILLFGGENQILAYHLLKLYGRMKITNVHPNHLGMNKDRMLQRQLVQ
eukprot:scaffold43425_cov57-Attheya_sp.AAC.4